MKRRDPFPAVTPHTKLVRALGYMKTFETLMVEVSPDAAEELAPYLDVCYSICRRETARLEFNYHQDDVTLCRDAIDPIDL